MELIALCHVSIPRAPIVDEAWWWVESIVLDVRRGSTVGCVIKSIQQRRMIVNELEDGKIASCSVFKDFKYFWGYETQPCIISLPLGNPGKFIFSTSLPIDHHWMRDSVSLLHEYFRAEKHWLQLYLSWKLWTVFLHKLSEIGWIKWRNTIRVLLTPSAESLVVVT